jgi:hypothetical protein
MSASVPVVQKHDPVAPTRDTVAQARDTVVPLRESVALPSQAATPPRDTTALAFVWAGGIACVLTAVALLSSAGTGALQDTLKSLGFGREKAIEVQQRQQAHTIAELERAIRNVGREVGTLNTRMAVTEHKEGLTSEALQRLDGDLTVVRAEVADARTARHEVMRLRSTIDANDRNSQKTITTLTKRLDKLEQQMATASIPPASAAAAKAAKRREKPVEAPEPDVISDAMNELMVLHGLRGGDGPSGHVIDKPGAGH